MYTLRLSKFANLYSGVNLQSLKNVFVFMMYAGLCLVAAALTLDSDGTPLVVSCWTEAIAALWPGWGASDAWQVWLLVAYGAIGPGVAKDLLQQSGQKVIAASEASVIMTTQSVFTAVFAFVLLGEMLSLKEMLGGLLIVVAALMTSTTSSPSRVRRIK